MLTKLKLEFLKSVRNKKLNVFSLFFLLAFLFLVLSKLSKTYTQTVTFKTNYVNVPENKVINTSGDQKLEVLISSLGFNLLPYYFHAKTLDIDFEKDVTSKNGHYLWISNVSKYTIEKQLGKSIKIISIKPDTLKFLFESLETKIVPIELDSKVTFASGYDMLFHLKTLPDSIRVIGSKSILNEVQSIKTEVFKRNDVNSEIMDSVTLIIPKTNSELKLSQNKVKVAGLVEKFTEGTIDVPVSIINLPDNVKINYFPKEVSVSYYVPLSNYKNIKDLDFKIVCDYNLISKNTFFRPVLAKIPKEIKSAKMKQDKIEFIILQ